MGQLHEVRRNVSVSRKQMTSHKTLIKIYFILCEKQNTRTMFRKNKSTKVICISGKTNTFFSDFKFLDTERLYLLRSLNVQGKWGWLKACYD